MSRMTKPIIDDYYSGYYTNGQLSSGIVKLNEKDFTNAAILKLGQLEDIEELFEKIVSQPIWEKYTDTGEVHQENYTECDALYNFKKNRIELYMYDFVNYFEIDMYGKTWALTKEELL